MIDDQEVVRAKAVLKNAGYYCIPREKVMKIQAERFVDHLAMMQYGDDPKFIEHLHVDMHRMIGIEMMKHAVCECTSISQDEKNYSGRSGEVYRIKADILPFGLVTDPVLDFLREKQR